MVKKKKKKKKVKPGLETAVEELYGIMKDESLSEVSWEEDEGFKLHLKRKTIPVFSSPVKPPAKKTGRQEKEEEVKDYIRSPMNGVFYRSPDPGSDPFVEEGQEISQGTTVCIIEAMKLMNEVQVERHCVIDKVLAADGSAVKVNDPLFEVKPH